MKKMSLLKEFYGAWVLEKDEEKKIVEERKKFRNDFEESMYARLGENL